LFSKISKHDSGITIGDILSIFDGLCELKGLVYIMTTNHIDFLDPALIRSGRVTKRIKLEKMAKPEIIEMLKYYFVDNDISNDTVSKSQDLRTKMNVINKIGDKFNKKIKPSQMEELCGTKNLTQIFGHSLE
jgi:SpoVK/Ycf46/Vps4 family AAA+-type ATPase